MKPAENFATCTAVPESLHIPLHPSDAPSAALTKMSQSQLLHSYSQVFASAVVGAVVVVIRYSVKTHPPRDESHSQGIDNRPKGIIEK